MWRVQSFQSYSASSAFDLNDGNYYAYIEDANRMQIMPNIKTVAITRGQYSPTIVGINREMDKTIVTVRIRAADWRTALKNLLAAIPNDEVEPGTLTVTDENGDEWTIQARVSQMMRTKFDKVYEIHLDVPDLIWRKAATVDTWNITASGQTTIINNTGNRRVRPVFTFTPTAIKADGFLYRHWVPIINPQSDRGFSFWAVDLTDGGLDTRPWVKDTANYMQINDAAGITDSQTTIPYDTKTEADAGIIGTYGMGYLDDGVHVEQICWTGRTGSTSGNLTGVTRAIGGTTAHAFADNTKIYLSYAQADGRDLRFYRNGIEQNLWVDGFNTATTKMWVVATERAGIALTLGAAIASSGEITEIEFEETMANRAALMALPEEGVFRIGDEAFHYTSRDPNRFYATVDGREINDTVAEAHTIGDNVYLIRNDCWLYSGNPFLPAQVTNDTRKPPFELDTSTNVTRDYEIFGSSTGLRANSWVPKVEASSFPLRDEASITYTGEHLDTEADPYTRMGARMQSIYKGGMWRFENGRITWSIYEPAGIATVTSWTYEKYRTGSTWPAYARLEKSRDGITWALVATVATPASASSWGSPATVGPYSLGTGYYYLRVIFYGVQGNGQSGGVGYLSALETNALKYETVSPLVPEIMTRHAGSYEHNFLFQNTTTDEYFKLILTDVLNGEIEIDCEAKTVTTLADGKKHRAALLVPNTQRDWMTLAPGNNTLRHVESGVTGLTVDVSHQDQLAV